MPHSTPRRYTRLDAEQLANMRDAWVQGVATIEEIADQFGMSKRGVEMAMKRAGAVRGSKPPPLLEVALPTVSPGQPSPIVTPGSRDHRIRQTTEEAWAGAAELEAATRAVIRAVAAAPTPSSLRVLDRAAAVLIRVTRLRFQSLGLDNGSRLPVEAEALPELPIISMSAEDEAEIRSKLASGAASWGDLDEADCGDDDVVAYDPDDADDAFPARSHSGLAPVRERVGGDDGPY